MASSSDFRICIDVGNSPRTLLSVRVIEKKKTVYLILKRARKFRDFRYSSEEAGKTPEHSALTLTQKYTIHPSNHLEFENYIHHTLQIEGRSQPFETAQYTKAIKSGDRFAMLYARRAPNLQHSTYESGASGAKILSIGSYEPLYGTLCYSVVVGAASCRFPSIIELGMEPSPLNIWQHVFGNINIAIIFSFISLPSDSTGALVHLMSVDPVTLRGEWQTGMQKFVDGLHPLHVLVHSLKYFQYLGNEMVLLLKKDFPESDKFAQAMLRCVDLYPEAFRGSASYREQKRRLILAGFTPGK